MDEPGPTDASVRIGVEADAGAVAAVHVRAWQWAYRGQLTDEYLDGLTGQLAQREEMFRRILGQPEKDRLLWVAERDGDLIGFCNATAARDGEPGTAELHTIYLEPSAVGQGIGAALMRRALRELRSLGFEAVVLWVLDANERARSFYEKGGWRLDGAEKTEPVWGVAVRMVRYRIKLG